MFDPYPYSAVVLNPIVVQLQRVQPISRAQRVCLELNLRGRQLVAAQVDWQIPGQVLCIYIYIYIYICLYIYICIHMRETPGSEACQDPGFRRFRLALSERSVSAFKYKSSAGRMIQQLSHLNHAHAAKCLHIHMAVAQKKTYQNGTLVSGNMDQNLRHPSCLKFEPHPYLRQSASGKRRIRFPET